jgi:hypothetical protein
MRAALRAVSSLVSEIVGTLQRAGHTLLSALREIFDESAYARFLTRQQRASSPEAYAIFWKEQEIARARRPKCC